MRGAGATLRRAHTPIALRRRVMRLLPSPGVPWALLALLGVALVVASGYRLWFRESGFVRVRQVTVTGVEPSHASRLRQILIAEGRRMSTLGVRQDRLEKLARTYPVVRALRARADPPHALRIHVIERRPGAMAIVGGARVPVAGDGVLLRGYPVKGALPVIGPEGRVPTRRLRDRKALRAARVLGAAPAALSPRLRDVLEAGQRGLVVRPRAGPDLVFGDLSRLSAKWRAVARLLAEPTAQGATYLDVRLPERATAGGLPDDGPEPGTGADANPLP